MGENLSADEKEDAVLTWLSVQEAGELEEACAAITLVCPQDRKGKKKALLKFLLKHLCDLEDGPDGDGAAILLLYDHAKSKGLPQSVKTEDMSETKSAVINKPQSVDQGDQKVKTMVDVLKLKDLKISVSIGGSEKEKLSYTSLSYQIANAEKAGYSEEQICAAVVKAISPGNNLRTYLESKPGLNLVVVTEILRSHFKEKDSASVFTELGNAVQQSTENALDFVIRLMCLRQKVLDLASQEGCPYQQNLLNKRMFHAMFTGLTNANIRVELRERCKNDFGITDTELLKFVSDVVANESERSEKCSVKKSVCEVAQVAQRCEKDVKNLPQAKNPFVQIEELKLNHQKELMSQNSKIDAMQIQLAEIKNAILGTQQTPAKTNTTNGDNYVQKQNPQYRKQRPPGRYRKCKQCDTAKNPRCFHCFTCGSDDHMMARCPKNE